MYGRPDVRRYWYLRVREELSKLEAKISRIDPGLFYWRENNTLIDILACHVDNMIWGCNQYFKGTIIPKLKEIFNFGPEEIQTKLRFWCEDWSKFIYRLHSKNIFIKRKNDRNISLTKGERTLYKSIVGQLNWVAGISRPDINFAVCESSTEFSDTTVADIIYANKIIRIVRSQSCFN